MAKTHYKQTGPWHKRTFWSAAIFVALATSGPTAALGQALPVAGFAPTDANPILEISPFGRSEFSPLFLGGGNGVAESTLKELITSITTDPRFSPSVRPGAIAKGAVLRPPPDSILWPIANDDAIPPPMGNLDLWIFDTRPESALHRTNARMLKAIGSEALAQSGTGLSFISPLSGPGIATQSQSLAFTPSRLLIANMQTLEAECGSRPNCAAIDRALRWTASNILSEQMPIQAKIGQAIFDAASVGAFTETPDQRLATMESRADRRRQLSVTDNEFFYELSDQTRYRIELVEKLPWEISIVIGAAVLEMRKLEKSDLIWPVSFNNGTAQALKEPVFRYQGFDLSAVALTYYRRSFSGAMDLSAILMFVDENGRKGIVSAVLSFVISGNGIKVINADLALIPSPTNRVRLVITPSGVSPNANFSGLLNAAVEKEVTPQTVESFPQEFEVQAFFLDRLPPDAQVEMRLGIDETGTAGFGVGTAVDFDGWRMAKMVGTFSLNGPSEFFIKALVQPGGPVPGFDRDPKLAGVISSHRGHPPNGPANPTPPRQERTFPNLLVKL